MYTNPIKATACSCQCVCCLQALLRPQVLGAGTAGPGNQNHRMVGLEGTSRTMELQPHTTGRATNLHV